MIIVVRTARVLTLQKNTLTFQRSTFRLVYNRFPTAVGGFFKFNHFLKLIVGLLGSSGGKPPEVFIFFRPPLPPPASRRHNNGMNSGRQTSTVVWAASKPSCSIRSQNWPAYRRAPCGNCPTLALMLRLFCQKSESEVFATAIYKS